MTNEIATLAERLGAALGAAGLRLVTAESCTGGRIAEAVTAVPGSSAWFDRGVVAYSNEAKQEMLDVPASLIDTTPIRVGHLRCRSPGSPCRCGPVR